MFLSRLLSKDRDGNWCRKEGSSKHWDNGEVCRGVESLLFSHVGRPQGIELAWRRPAAERSSAGMVYNFDRHWRPRRVVAVKASLWKIILRIFISESEECMRSTSLCRATKLDWRLSATDGQPRPFCRPAAGTGGGILIKMLTFWRLYFLFIN
jgi:hypothetical protein